MPLDVFSLLQLRAGRKTGSFFVRPSFSRFRLYAFAVHLAISTVVVAVIAAVVLLIWYPGVLAATEGIWPILGLLILVDVCLGPLLTLVVANPLKPRKELRRDISVIAAAQVIAVSIALHSAYVARPVFIVFDGNRFETVSSAELDPTGVDPSRLEFILTPWSRPKWVYAEPPRDAEERQRIVVESVSGGPEFKNLLRLFRPWPFKGAAIVNTVRSLDAVGKQASDIAAQLATLGIGPNEVGLFPLLGRLSNAVVVVRRDTLEVLFSAPYQEDDRAR